MYILYMWACPINPLIMCPEMVSIRSDAPALTDRKPPRGGARALLASYYKTCILLQDLHPATRPASCYKTCILLQDKHPIAIRLASYYKTSI